jgi:hypothetical protein
MPCSAPQKPHTPTRPTVVSRLKERIEHEQDCPLLSCADIETLLAHFLSRRDNGVDEVIRQMEERHRKRQTSIDFSYAKQRAGADL